MVQYLCIITHPRSGATVVQRILNSMSNTTFRGENGGVIVDLCTIINKITDLSGDHPYLLKMDPTLDKYPLYGVNLFNPESALKTIREFFINEIIKPDINSTYIGWKENWLDPNVYGEKIIHNYIDIIQNIFPGVKIVFNLRNPTDTANSQGWFGKSNVKKIVDNYHCCYNNYYKKNSKNKNLLIINHEDWCGNPEFMYETLNQFDLPVKLRMVQDILKEDLVHLKNL